MITQTTYICEVCHSVWDESWKALKCEGYVAPPCPVKVGDEVMVYSRYDEPEKDVVVAVKLLASNYPYLALSNDHPEGFHVWHAETENSHQLGKDWFTQNIEMDYLHRMDGTCVVPHARECEFCPGNGSGDGTGGRQDWSEAEQKWKPVKYVLTTPYGPTFVYIRKDNKWSTPRPSEAALYNTFREAMAVQIAHNNDPKYADTQATILSVIADEFVNGGDTFSPYDEEGLS